MAEREREPHYCVNNYVFRVICRHYSANMSLIKAS